MPFHRWTGQISRQCGDEARLGDCYVRARSTDTQMLHSDPLLSLQLAIRRPLLTQLYTGPEGWDHARADPVRVRALPQRLKVVVE